MGRMLILTRKAGERIKIGHYITIVVMEIQHNRVQLGVEAPKDIQVDRAEIREQKRKR